MYLRAWAFREQSGHVFCLSKWDRLGYMFFDPATVKLLNELSMLESCVTDDHILAPSMLFGLRRNVEVSTSRRKISIHVPKTPLLANLLSAPKYFCHHIILYFPKGSDANQRYVVQIKFVMDCGDVNDRSSTIESLPQHKCNTKFVLFYLVNVINLIRTYPFPSSLFAYGNFEVFNNTHYIIQRIYV